MLMNLRYGLRLVAYPAYLKNGFGAREFPCKEWIAL